jgi:carboxypeptidase Taq
MRYSSKVVERLSNTYKEISLLGKINAVLGWDLEVNLPPKGLESRSAQNAYVTKLISERWLDKNFKDDLERAGLEKNLTLEEKAIVRNLNHAAKFYHRVPKELIVEFSETTSKAFMAWREAREKGRFNVFEPHLKKIVHISRLFADYIGYRDNPYDALLDIYEPGLTTKECKNIFNELVPGIAAILKDIKKSKLYKEENDLGVLEFSPESQKQIANFVLSKMNYDLDAGRMDISAHPFTTELGSGDIRITNRYNSHNFIESIMVAMHEGGHALYEQGIFDEYSNTPLEGGVSLGIHESQSRFWENQVGRSQEFIQYLVPILNAFYPNQLANEDTGTLYKKFNQVRPSLIRVEADEVTYNLHIALRYELEEALLNKKVEVNQLPEIWAEKMKKYLGVAPKNNSEGVLQDIHWSHGTLGYFPTYTLGNLYAAQLTHFMRKEVDITKAIKSGEFGVILSWLRSNIHQHGSVYWPGELIKRITKKSLDPTYFLDYLSKKYGELYD